MTEALASKEWVGLLKVLNERFPAQLRLVDEAPVLSVQHIGWEGFLPKAWPDFVTFESQHHAFIIEKPTVTQSTRNFGGSGIQTVTLTGATLFETTKARLGAGEFDGKFRVLRSRIYGLDAWASLLLDNYQRIDQTNENGAILRTTFEYTVGTDRLLAAIGDTQLLLSPHFEGVEGGDNDDGRTVTMRRFFWVVSASPTPLPVDEHFKAQNALRDLLALLSGLPLDYTRHEATNTEWGASPSGPWCRVHLRRWQVAGQAWTSDEALRVDSFPFDASQLQTEWLERWLVERVDCQRAIDPWLTSIYHGSNIPEETKAVELGIAIESYGRSMANTDRYIKAVRQVLNAGQPGTGRLQQNISKWAVVADSNFRSIRHSNNPSPEPLHTHLVNTLAREALTQCLLRRIGAPASIGEAWASRWSIDGYRRMFQSLLNHGDIRDWLAYLESNRSV